jgi:hypothetical protein
MYILGIITIGEKKFTEGNFFFFRFLPGAKKKKEKSKTGQ